MFGLSESNSFRHGIHPPEMKDDTSHLAIRRFPFAPQLIVPLSQHLGSPATPEVRAGQEVTRGQVIAEPDGFMSVAMHAPASGTVRKIGLSPAIGGNMTLTTQAVARYIPSISKPANHQGKPTKAATDLSQGCPISKKRVANQPDGVLAPEMVIQNTTANNSNIKGKPHTRLVTILSMVRSISN